MSGIATVSSDIAKEKYLDAGIGVFALFLGSKMDNLIGTGGATLKAATQSLNGSSEAGLIDVTTKAVILGTDQLLDKGKETAIEHISSSVENDSTE